MGALGWVCGEVGQGPAWWAAQHQAAQAECLLASCTLLL